jgi:hypothetical protein
MFIEEIIGRKKIFDNLMKNKKQTKRQKKMHEKGANPYSYFLGKMSLTYIYSSKHEYYSCSLLPGALPHHTK